MKVIFRKILTFFLRLFGCKLKVEGKVDLEVQLKEQPPSQDAQKELINYGEEED